jgi:cytochrome c oxidase subunit 2
MLDFVLPVMKLPPLDLGAAQERWLFAMLVAWTAVFFGVLVAMLCRIVGRRRQQHGDTPGPRESMAAEIAWTVVPFVIVIVMALLAARGVAQR